jgi:hypothetical protein
MEFGVFGRFRYAASRAKIGDCLSVVAGLFVTGCEGEVINSARRYNWQEWACVKFGKNSFAPRVLYHAELFSCRPPLSVSGLRHASFHLWSGACAVYTNRLLVLIAGQGNGGILPGTEERCYRGSATSPRDAPYTVQKTPEGKDFGYFVSASRWQSEPDGTTVVYVC